MESADLFIPYDMLQLLNQRFVGLFYWKQGSFSHIFHGTDRTSNRRLAIKIVCTEFFTTEDTPTWVLDHIQADAFRAKGIDFSRVVRLYDIVVARTSIAFISEYMDSGTIDDLIRNPKEGYSSDDFFTTLWVDLLTGCAEMEVAGLCCRSLSAQHVLVNEDMHGHKCFKISDLGLTKHFACIFRWANNQKHFAQQKSALISKSIAGIVLKLGLAVAKLNPPTTKLKSIVLAKTVLRGDFSLPTLMVMVSKHLKLQTVPSDWVNYVRLRSSQKKPSVFAPFVSFVTKKRVATSEPWSVDSFVAEVPYVTVDLPTDDDPELPKVELHPLWEDAIRTVSLEFEAIAPKSI